MSFWHFLPKIEGMRSFKGTPSRIFKPPAPPLGHQFLF
nr:MAG TPA: Keratinocyte differentiation-associated [Caudoviricetes sp.]